MATTQSGNGLSHPHPSLHRGMSGFQSVRSLGAGVLSHMPIQRESLRKYSWLPDALTIKGSVLGRIWGPVLSVAVFSGAVAAVNDFAGIPLNLNNTVIPLLSVVIGLLLVFRNGTSYDRYYEGRRDFGSVSALIRNLSRLVWIQVIVPPSAVKDEKAHLGAQDHASLRAELKAEKIRFIKLLLSFVYATMHHLRGEPGLDYADYEGILPKDFEDLHLHDSALAVDHEDALNRFAAYSSVGGGISEQVASATKRPESASRRTSFTVQVQHGQDGTMVNSLNETTPLINPPDHTALDFHQGLSRAYIPLPLKIIHEATRVLFEFKRKGYFEVPGPAGFNGTNTLLNNLVDQLTNLERVATTPIPASYGIHLKQCVTLYLFALPFTLVQAMHWRMVPLVTIVAFTLMGIEGIADEIEMPFGRDQSDLPLERFCGALKSELEYLVQRMPESGDSSPL